jgi:hypothetical protein
MVLESDQPEIFDERGAALENLFNRVLVFQHCNRSSCRYETERVPTVAAAVFSIAFPPLNETDVMSFEETDKGMMKIGQTFLLSEK